MALPNIALISLAAAKEHIRIDEDADEDTDLQLKINAASQAVINYLKDRATVVLSLDSSGEPEQDSSGEPTGIPANVQMAVLLLTGIFYRDRDGQEMSKWAPGYLPPPVTALLYPNRDPAFV